MSTGVGTVLHRSWRVWGLSPLDGLGVSPKARVLGAPSNPPEECAGVGRPPAHPRPGALDAGRGRTAPWWRLSRRQPPRRSCAPARPLCPREPRHRWVAAGTRSASQRQLLCCCARHRPDPRKDSSPKAAYPPVSSSRRHLQSGGARRGDPDLPELPRESALAPRSSRRDLGRPRRQSCWVPKLEGA